MTDEEHQDHNVDGEDVWQDVGEQFRILGKSIAGAIRTAWDDEDTQRRVEQIRGGFDSMFAEINDAFQSTADSPEVQHFRAEAKESFRNLRDTGEQAAVELRPHVIKILRQVNAELEKAIGRMDSEESDSTPDREPVE